MSDPQTIATTAQTVVLTAIAIDQWRVLAASVTLSATTRRHRCLSGVPNPRVDDATRLALLVDLAANDAVNGVRRPLPAGLSGHRLGGGADGRAGAHKLEDAANLGRCLRVDLHEPIA